LDKFSDGGIAALHSAREQHPGSPIRVDHDSDRLTPHGAWLLAAPHGQGDIELIPPRHVASSEICDRPSQPLDTLIADVSAVIKTSTRTANRIQPSRWIERAKVQSE
jgi:hypothetical protein